MKMYNIEHAVNEFVPLVIENTHSLKFILSEEKSEHEKMFDDFMTFYQKNPIPMTVGYVAEQKGVKNPEQIKNMALMLDYASRVGFLGKDRLVHIANGNLEPHRCWCYVYNKEMMEDMETEMRDIADNKKSNNLRKKIKSYLKLEKILTNEANERYIKRAFETKQGTFEPEEFKNINAETFITIEKQFFKNGVGCYSELSENFPLWLKRLQESGAQTTKERVN